MERSMIAMVQTADAVQQIGFLSLPFHRIYFKDATVLEEEVETIMDNM